MHNSFLLSLIQNGYASFVLHMEKFNGITDTDNRIFRLFAIGHGCQADLVDDTDTSLELISFEAICKTEYVCACYRKFILFKAMPSDR